MQKVHETVPGKDLPPPSGGRGRRQADCSGPGSDRSRGQSPATPWRGEEARGRPAAPKSSLRGELTEKVVPPKGKAREPPGQKWGPALEKCRPCDSTGHSWTGRRERKEKANHAQDGEVLGALPAPLWHSPLIWRPELSLPQFPSNGDTQPLPAHQCVR